MVKWVQVGLMGAVLSGLGGVWAVAAEEGMAAVADGEGGASGGDGFS